MSVKAIVIFSILPILLAGCYSGNYDGKQEAIEMTVYQVKDDQHSKWACVGTNYSTMIQSDDHRTARLCGDWGPVGTKIRGTWTSGAIDGGMNGFRLN